MIYWFRSEIYELIIENHNYRLKHGYSDDEYSDYSDEESSDSSLEGRNRLYFSTRRRNRWAEQTQRNKTHHYVPRILDTGVGPDRDGSRRSKRFAWHARVIDDFSNVDEQTGEKRND